MTPEPYWTDGHATIWHGNALALPLEDESVDLVVTSPPYFGLRSYQDGGEHYDGQIGSEAAPAEFVDALIAATREMVRVLKPSGSIFVNLGDKYNAYNGNRGNGTIQNNDPRPTLPTGNGLDVKDIRPKSLLGIPWRYALRCIDDLGLILRAEIIWSKPNGLPESVTDRVRRSHEQWFHMVKEPRYYSAVDEVREAHVQPDRVRSDMFGGVTGTNGVRHAGASVYTGPTNALGKLPGSVWTVPTQPLRVPAHLGIDHFAAFPLEFPRRIITGWSPRDVCVACGEGRRPVSVVDYETVDSRRGTDARGLSLSDRRGNGQPHGNARRLATITGYVCACTPYTDHKGSEERSNRRADNPYGKPNREQGVYSNKAGEYERVGPWREYHFDRWTPADTTPGVVLDPFMGTGTTLLAATVLGRDSHGVDLSSDYCRLGKWRINDPREIARAMQVEKPEPVIDGQTTIFDEMSTA